MQAAVAYVDRFQFQVGETPLSEWQAPAITCLVYVGTVMVTKAAMRSVNKKPMAKDGPLRFFNVLHNFFLSFSSIVLLGLIAYELVKIYSTAGGGFHGFFRIYCDPKPHQNVSGKLVFYYYLNYLLKYYELLDTMILVLAGKKTAFLHVYHHAATLTLCWSQLYTLSAVQWVPITLNLLVHFFMYYYYGMASLGRQVWWKKYLTTCQIVQFVVDVFACSLSLALRHNAEARMNWFPGNTWCGGDYWGAYFGIGLLFSYLVLFVQFFIATYLRGTVSSKAKRA